MTHRQFVNNAKAIIFADAGDIESLNKLHFTNESDVTRIALDNDYIKIIEHIVAKYDYQYYNIGDCFNKIFERSDISFLRKLFNGRYINVASHIFCNLLKTNNLTMSKNRMNEILGLYIELDIKIKELKIEGNDGINAGLLWLFVKNGLIKIDAFDDGKIFEQLLNNNIDDNLEVIQNKQFQKYYKIMKRHRELMFQKVKQTLCPIMPDDILNLIFTNVAFEYNSWDMKLVHNKLNKTATEHPVTTFFLMFLFFVFWLFIDVQLSSNKHYTKLKF